jgi:hypothetical protein
MEGNCNPVYYISWEGTTDQGPYLLELSDPDSTASKAQRSVLSNIMPLMSVVANADPLYDGTVALLPFTSAVSLPSILPSNHRQLSESHLAEQSCSLGLRNSILSAGESAIGECESMKLKPQNLRLRTFYNQSSAARNEGGIDESLVSALGSISMKSDRSKALMMSHKQKSKRILQHCSSWTQLDDIRANRGIIHGQGIANLLLQDNTLLSFLICYFALSNNHLDAHWGTDSHANTENKHCDESADNTLQPNIILVVPTPRLFHCRQCCSLPAKRR